MWRRTRKIKNKVNIYTNILNKKKIYFYPNYNN